MPLIKFVIEKEDNNFVMDWMDELNWEMNPFEHSMENSLDEFCLGNKKEKSKLNVFVIGNQKFGVIKGEEGVGKTTLLKWLEAHLKKHSHQVIVNFIDCREIKNESQLIQTIIKPLVGLFEKFTAKKELKSLNSQSIYPYLKKKLKRKRIVLLFDNIHKVYSDFPKIINRFLVENLNLQMVLAGKKQDIAKIKLIHHKDDLKIELHKMDYEGVRAMIQKRIEAVGGEDIVPFTDTLLKKITQKSSYNPKKIIETCKTMAMKSTVFHKLDKESTELNPPMSKETKKPQTKKFDEIRKKVGTINYIKGKKKKPEVEVIDNKSKIPSEDEYVDVPEKEKNDKLISELFEKK